MTVGKVYLVGAGPGHPLLLTLKGQELIRIADVIVYDRLVQEETMAAARPDAERLYVGKLPGRHQSRQEEINRLLVEAAHRAGVVVRLKGGDPVLFSRGAEEAEYLAAHGVPFELVPGVTAALAVPTAAGIPITHRDLASTVALVTAHRREGSGEQLDWGALARIDTVVFFMGVNQLEEIAEQLMAHGRSGATPSAVIQMAYWPEEQVVVGSLSDLPRLAREQGVRPPATIVVGEVVRLRDRMVTLHRELRRDHEEPVGAGLSAAALLGRVGSALRSAKDAAAAAELGLFDELVDPITAEELARRLGLLVVPLQEVLSRLAGLGLLLADRGTYRNSEAASRYLCRRSPDYLGPELRAVLSESLEYDPLKALGSR